MPWKCTNCGYTTTDKTYPDRCPSCGEACAFVDATCYIPDCGGPDERLVDPRVGQKDKDTD
ncbi:MAG: rubredoxin-like domain-containing protein [Desulfotomaculales bacterium]